MSPITQEQYWKVVCDECGEPFPEGDAGGYQLADDERSAKEMVTDYDGEVAPDGKITCPVCIEERPAVTKETHHAS